jgi:hypothetical protein
MTRFLPHDAFVYHVLPHLALDKLLHLTDTINDDNDSSMQTWYRVADPAQKDELVVSVDHVDLDDSVTRT